MSQSHNSTDSQALLQSMLQRLKLQSGREGHQAYLHTPSLVTVASTCGQDGERGTSTLQKGSNSPLNGFQLGTNSVPSKNFGISAVDSNCGLKCGEIQQPGLGYEVDKRLISFPTQKGNTDGDRGDNKVLGQVVQSGITPTGTGQLLPAKSLKDADITSFKRTEGQRVSFGSSGMTSMGHNQAKDQVFTPKVYAWSLKPGDANHDVGSQENRVFHMGNGGYGALAQSKDMQVVETNQKTTNSSSRRKQRSSENKGKRWTQKIKEKWRDRPGSFGKKGKEECREIQTSEQGPEISPQNQMQKTLTNTSSEEAERTLLSLDSSDPSKTPLTNTEDSTKEGDTRSASDFEFGLGSFSLLEEITTGQEWARFLNLNQPVASADQRSLENVKTPPDPHDSSQSSLISIHQGGVNNQWSFGGTEASPVSDFSMAQISPDAFQPVSMDVSQGKQQQFVYKEADRFEPMEHAQTKVVLQSGDPVGGQQLRPPTFVKPADILNNSALRSRAQGSRKRQHQSAESRDENMTDGKEANRDSSMSSLSQASSHMMEEAGQSQNDSVMPSYILNSPSPLSPSSFTPFASTPKGVLKHSMSQDSMSSVEVVTKRRRVEENRRVHFSEDVVTIVPPELDVDVTDSEEDSGAEDDSVTGQECEVEQAMIEEVVPARRPALPAWIKALKRRNTGRKPRQ